MADDALIRKLKLKPGHRAALRQGGLLWIAFPKRTSKIQTDLTRDQGWDAVRDTSLLWINLVSLDDT